ncbi:TlpA disulfide reductase family protein [Sphingomonas sp. LY160]|uniref:TlpA family protein disulfide reductase n=1 Tax=Sphingomonas sp. LY160 TaxID=3095342 RepID=UPI002ADEC16A|nr:TlpA disulfide reductase family protein [Sphingomonas sp. LY160]MEA1072546.1 TlpA disulfide reductase family protein [Sphingomonas sp. LY160]
MPVSLRLIALLLGLTVVAGCDRQKPAAPQAPVEGPTSSKGVDRSHRGEAAPTVAFNDPDGKSITLAALAGKPVLVNLWASWCAPCVKELPTLAALQASQGADGPLTVIAVSQDMGPKSSVDAFLQGKGIARFAAYHDPEMKLTDALGVQVMPTTILYDGAGKEVWRFVGDQDWSGAEAKALLAEVSPEAAR